MNLSPVLKYTLVGLVAVAAIAGLLFVANRGQQVRLDGQILKVRTIATPEDSSIAVIDFRVANPAKVHFMVRSAQIILAGASGETVTVDPIAEMDLDRVLSYYQMTGPRFNPTLKPKERIIGSSTVDRTIAGSFSLPESTLARRKSLTVRIEDTDGAVVDIAEKR